MLALLIGFILGFGSAIPVAGPISALVLSYSLKSRYDQARFLALGAVIVESIYAFIAFLVFGELLSQFKTAFLFSNFVFVGVLISLGVYFFHSKRLRNPVEVLPSSVTRQTKSFFTGVGVAGANPSVIVSWGAAIGLLHSIKAFEFTMSSYGLFSLGICFGSFAWFVLFVQIVRKHHNRFDPMTTDKILKGLACFLFVLAVWIGYGTIRQMI